MKTSLLALASILISTAAPLRAASQPILKAEVIGTVQTQTILSPTNGRIHTAVLNNKRIFQEFQVSKSDYELVFDLNGSSGVALVPKRISDNLPTIAVVPLGSTSAEVIDTKARAIALTASLGTSSATNLFKNLTGELGGTIHYSGSLNTPVFTKFVFSVLGSGTDNTGGGAILKFKVTAKGVFNQAP